MVADHINRFKYDNRSDNLRIVSLSMNSRNTTKRKDNVSGIKGICLDRKGRYMYWEVVITTMREYSYLNVLGSIN